MPWDEINDPDFHYGNAPAYLKSVEDLAARNGIETIIAGHLVVEWDSIGEAIVYPSSGSIDTIRERRQLYEQMLSAVKEKLDAGVPILTVHNTIDLEPFEDVRGFNEQRMRLFLQRIAYFYVLGR